MSAWEEDEHEDFMPSEEDPVVDQFFEDDVEGDLMPLATSRDYNYPEEWQATFGVVFGFANQYLGTAVQNPQPDPPIILSVVAGNGQLSIEVQLNETADPAYFILQPSGGVWTAPTEARKLTADGTYVWDGLMNGMLYFVTALSIQGGYGSPSATVWGLRPYYVDPDWNTDEPMPHHPSRVFLEVLKGEGLITKGSEGGAWPFYLDHLPEVDGNMGAVYDTEGDKDGRKHAGGRNMFHYGVQVRIRSLTYATGWEKAREISARIQRLRPGFVTVDSTTYRAGGYSQPSQILSAGLERGSKRRFMFTINVRFPLKKEE